MKKVIYIITTILLCMTSCTDIHDTYSEYIKDGEQIYVGKLADVKIHPGFQRMMITGSMKYLATAKTCIIELVGYDKVFTTDIDRTQPEFSYEIKDVEEGNYYVKITTKDKEGNTRKTFEVLADTAHFADSKKKDNEQKETKKEKTISKKESNDTEPMEESSHGRW